MGKFVLVVLVFAFVVYGVLRLIERQRDSGGTARRRPAASQRRVVAPDDDEDFLRTLRRNRGDHGGPDSSEGG